MKITLKTKVIDFSEYDERGRSISKDVQLTFPEDWEIEIKEDGIYASMTIERKDTNDKSEQNSK